VIPVTTASKRLFNRDYLTSMLIQLEDPTQSGKAIEDITALMRERHGIVPPVLDDFRVTSPAAQVERLTEVGSTLSRILIGVAVIATLIGGTVIMSLMLIAVSERRKEIGVRRAVGASRLDIMAQFLAEAAVISLIGGLLGIVIGVGGTTLATALAQLPPAIMWSAVGGAAALSIGVGLVFGLFSHCTEWAGRTAPCRLFWRRPASPSRAAAAWVHAHPWTKSSPRSVTARRASPHRRGWCSAVRSTPTPSA
jgi:putative ABC transport system permease protein